MSYVPKKLCSNVFLCDSRRDGWCSRLPRWLESVPHLQAGRQKCCGDRIREEIRLPFPSRQAVCPQRGHVQQREGFVAPALYTGLGATRTKELRALLVQGVAAHRVGIGSQCGWTVTMRGIGDDFPVSHLGLRLRSSAGGCQPREFECPRHCDDVVDGVQELRITAPVLLAHPVGQPNAFPCRSSLSSDHPRSSTTAASVGSSRRRLPGRNDLRPTLQLSGALPTLAMTPHSTEIPDPGGPHSRVAPPQEPDVEYGEMMKVRSVSERLVPI